jgi:hypothetical protein
MTEAMVTDLIFSWIIGLASLGFLSIAIWWYLIKKGNMKF